MAGPCDSPHKSLGIKVGAVIGQIQAGHSIEIIGTLEIAEGQRAGQIGRHGHGVEALHGGGGGGREVEMGGVDVEGEKRGRREKGGGEKRESRE